MPGLAELEHISISDIGGPYTRLEPGDVPTNKALLSLNSEYNPGNCGTRKGFASVWSANEPVNSMFNWIFSTNNYLVYYNSTSGKMRLATNLSSPSPVDLYTNSGASGVSTASGGSRLFIGHFDSNGAGIGQARVVGQYGPAIYTDKAFLGPLSTKPTLTDTGTGSVTSGVHRVGYIMQTRNGFLGKLCPYNSTAGTFDTTSTVTASGGKTIGFSLTATWPAEMAVDGRVYPIMTTAANLDRYYIVPGVTAATVPAGSWTISFTLDISDSDLGSTGVDVTDHLNLLTQDGSGNGPFNPSSVIEYGSRMVYLSESQAYVSEPDAHQRITADQHVIYLPGFRKMVAGFVLGRVLYICGPNWTYSFEDTGDVPVSWPSPRLVDGSIGTLSPRGCTVNAAQGFACIVHQTGLQILRGGSLETRSISYFTDPEWKRINWNTPAPVQVIDNKDKQQIYVLAPLTVTATVSTATTGGVHNVTWVSGEQFSTAWTSGTAITIGGTGYTISSVTSATALTLTTTAGTQASVAATIAPSYNTHVLMYDYSNGLAPEDVKFSLWDISTYAPGAGSVVLNQTTKKLELWVGKSSAGNVLRQMNQSDTLPYNDDGAGINWQFETALLPGLSADLGRVYHHYADQIRATGSGTLSMTVYGLDRTKSVASTITLGSAPGAAYTKLYPRLRSDSASVRLSTSAANHYCLFSAIDHYYGVGPYRS